MRTHGVSASSTGCRCAICVNAKKAYNRKYKAMERRLEAEADKIIFSEIAAEAAKGKQ